MAPPSKTNSFPVKNNYFPYEDCSNLKEFSTVPTWKSLFMHLRKTKIKSFR